MEKALSFLKKLKKNNNREWFEKHKAEYLEVKAGFERVCDKVIAAACKFDQALDPGTRASDCMFRIYRDIRFSKDKTPYKAHLSASFNPGGRKSVTAGYYLHVEPDNKSFIAGGVWMPETAMLQSIRQEIDYQPDELIRIMKSAPFRKYFKGFDEEGKLKTVPKGYDKDHPHIEILKNRNFIVSHMFTDEEVLQRKFVDRVTEACKAMYPLMQYLRVAQQGGD